MVGVIPEGRSNDHSKIVWQDFVLFAPLHDPVEVAQETDQHKSVKETLLRIESLDGLTCCTCS